MLDCQILFVIESAGLASKPAALHHSSSKLAPLAETHEVEALLELLVLAKEGARFCHFVIRVANEAACKVCESAAPTAVDADYRDPCTRQGRAVNEGVDADYRDPCIRQGRAVNEGVDADYRDPCSRQGRAVNEGPRFLECFDAPDGVGEWRGKEQGFSVPAARKQWVRVDGLLNMEPEQV
jgi:hypothetical protein